MPSPAKVAANFRVSYFLDSSMASDHSHHQSRPDIQAIRNSVLKFNWQGANIRLGLPRRVGIKKITLTFEDRTSISGLHHLARDKHLFQRIPGVVLNAKDFSRPDS